MKSSKQYKQIAEKYNLSPEHPGLDVSPALTQLQHSPFRKLGVGTFLPGSYSHQYGPRFWDKPLNEGCLGKGLALAKYGAIWG
jgi:hypothetical protein